MIRNLCILLAAALVVALPFLLRKAPEKDAWQPGDPVLVVVTPHNEAIRYEFGRGFSRWHEEHFGQPVRIDWRAIGGTTEIVRYIEAQYQASARAWWQRSGRTWTPVLADSLLDRKLDPHKPPEEAKALARWQEARDLVISFRNTDDPAFFTTRLDVFLAAASTTTAASSSRASPSRPGRRKTSPPTSSPPRTAPPSSRNASPAKRGARIRSSATPSAPSASATTSTAWPS